MERQPFPESETKRIFLKELEMTEVGVLIISVMNSGWVSALKHESLGRSHEALFHPKYRESNHIGIRFRKRILAS